MERRGKMTESDESDSDLLALDDTGRHWKNKQPDRGTKPRNSKRAINVSRASSSTSRESPLPPIPRRQQNPSPVPPRISARQQAESDEEIRKAEKSEESEPDQCEEEEIPYLSEVAVEHRQKVKIILSLEELSVEKKLERLEDCVLVKVHRKFKEWLMEQENTTDFVKFLPEKCKNLAADWEANKDTEGLDPLVKKEGNDKAKEAYQRWKVKHGLVKEPEETDSDIKIQKEKPEKVIKERKSKIDRPVREKPVEPRPIRRVKTPKIDPNSGHRPKIDPSKADTKKPLRDKPVKEKSPVEIDIATEATENMKITEEPSIFPENMPKETTIVLLGSSGVGKSTFINATANLLVHESLNNARDNPLALINAEFNQISENTTSRPVKFDANYNKDGLVKTTEHFCTGQSVTQSACSYTFKIGDRVVRIIDTPGVNDTRGTEQDTKNFTEIVNYLGHFKKIDGFIFMLPPNETRLDLRFRYSMNELLTHLHSSAAQNIIFCMSNGKATNYRPGETYSVLKTYLNEIYEKRNIRIDPKGKVFVYDSEVFRYIAAYSNGIDFTEREINQIQGSWDHGRKELRRMLEHISSLTPHDVINTLSVTKVRRAIEELAVPLAELSKTHTQNMQLIEKQQRTLQKCMETGESLAGKLNFQEIHMVTIDLQHPVTVCAHRDCITLQELHPHGAKEIVYSQECHTECYIPNIKIGEFNENIRECEIFGDENDESRCTVCGHGYQHHRHLKYRLERKLIEIRNNEAYEQLARNNDQIAVAEKVIADLQQQRLQYQADLEHKQTTCAHFAVFLKKHGIMHYNDQYLVHLNKQIKEIDEHSEENPELLTRLTVSRDQYQALVKIFEDNAKNDGVVKSVEEIEQMINQLETGKDAQLMAHIQAIEQYASERVIFPDDPVIIVDDRSKWDRVKHKIMKEVGSIIRPSKPKQDQPIPKYRTRQPSSRATPDLKMPKNSSDHGKYKETSRRSQQHAPISDPELKLQASLNQLRQELKTSVDVMLKEAGRKVEGMNSDLRAARRDMEKAMYEGKAAIQQNQQMIARERGKFLDSLENNEQYYQKKKDELMAEIATKRLKDEEEEEQPTRECVVCGDEEKEATMFGCKPVQKNTEEQRDNDSDESSDDSTDDSDEEEIEPRARQPFHLRFQDPRYRMRLERRFISRMLSLSSNEEDEDVSHYICATCCKGYAASKVADGAIVTEELGFPCPESDCKRVLLWGPVSKILDEKTLKPLEARLATSALLGIDGIEYCKSCHFGVQIERQEQKFFACQNKDCKAVFCRTCHMDYGKHLNKTCDEVDPTRKDTMKALEEFLSAAKFRVCPKCGTRFTKDNDRSCNTMTCRCGMTMCYVCKESPVTHDGHFKKPPRFCPLFSDTDEIDRINLEHAIEEARKEPRYERLLPFLVERRDKLPAAGQQ